MTNEYTLQWKIKNFSHCWLEKGEPLVSPVFEPGLQFTKWTLFLCPKGVGTEYFMGVYLGREDDLFGPKTIEVSYKFEFLDMNGSLRVINDGSKYTFTKCSVSFIKEYVSQDEIGGTERNKIFPQDILIIRCAMWVEDRTSNAIKCNISAWTIFRTVARSFHWRIDGFSTLVLGRKNHFEIMNESKNVLIKFSLSSGSNGDIDLAISWGEGLKSFSFKISVIDSEGEKVNFGSHTFFSDDSKCITKTVISKLQLMKNESRYLPNDVLSLYCEYACSTGDISHIRETNELGIISPVVSEPIKIEIKPVVSQNQPHQTQALVEDLKSMYTDAILCDVELRTSTQKFQAHKAILSARSTVFSRMFSNDMKEKNSGHVDIPDLEDDTVRRMLQYIYTDVVEDLQLESATELYSAADKYAIFSLKEKCSRFLKDNLSPSKVCDLLFLADRHQDDDFKCAVQDYILCHDKDVFGSQEWKDFMATHLQLAADIMYRKIQQI